MISYLWRHRVRYSFGSKSWWRTWAKRVLTSGTVARATFRAARLRWRGAQIHQSAVLSKADIEGNLAQLSIGEFSFVGRVKIQVHDSVKIGARICINDGVHIFTASHEVDSPNWQPITRPVVIEDFAWIASLAIILPGVRIGRGAVVGAGAVVSKDIPAGAVASGNPCVVTEGRRSQNLDYSPVFFLAGVRAWLHDEADKS